MMDRTMTILKGMFNTLFFILALTLLGVVMLGPALLALYFDPLWLFLYVPHALLGFYVNSVEIDFLEIGRMTDD